MSLGYDFLPVRAAADGRRVRIEVLFAGRWVEVARINTRRAEELAQRFDERADDAYVRGAFTSEVYAADRFVAELDAAIRTIEGGE